MFHLAVSFRHQFEYLVTIFHHFNLKNFDFPNVIFLILNNFQNFHLEYFPIRLFLGTRCLKLISRQFIVRLVVHLKKLLGVALGDLFDLHLECRLMNIFSFRILDFVPKKKFTFYLWYFVKYCFWIQWVNQFCGFVILEGHGYRNRWLKYNRCRIMNFPFFIL